MSACRRLRNASTASATTPTRVTMPQVPTDYPQRLAQRGLRVSTFGDWTSCGGSADHRAVVLHHTASSSSVAPADDAAYCHHGTSDAPLYNVLCGRDGSVWVLTRNKSNSSGQINSTDRKSTRLNSSHLGISYAVFC